MIPSADAARYGSRLRRLKPDEPKGPRQAFRCRPPVPPLDLPPSRGTPDDPYVTEKCQDVHPFLRLRWMPACVYGIRSPHCAPIGSNAGGKARAYDLVAGISVPRKVSGPPETRHSSVGGDPPG